MPGWTGGLLANNRCALWGQYLRVKINRSLIVELPTLPGCLYQQCRRKLQKPRGRQSSSLRVMLYLPTHPDSLLTWSRISRVKLSVTSKNCAVDVAQMLWWEVRQWLTGNWPLSHVLTCWTNCLHDAVLCAVPDSRQAPALYLVHLIRTAGPVVTLRQSFVLCTLSVLFAFIWTIDLGQEHLCK